MTNVNYSCPRCGAPMSPGDKFCGECGADFIEELSRFCPNCHVEIRPGKKFCYNCGTRYLTKAGFFKRYTAYLEGDPEVKAEYSNIRGPDDNYDDSYPDDYQSDSPRYYEEELPQRGYSTDYSRGLDRDGVESPEYLSYEDRLSQEQRYFNQNNRPAGDYYENRAAQNREPSQSVKTDNNSKSPEPLNFEQRQHVMEMFAEQKDNFRYSPEPARPDFIKPREEIQSQNFTEGFPQDSDEREQNPKSEETGPAAINTTDKLSDVLPLRNEQSTAEQIAASPAQSNSDRQSENKTSDFKKTEASSGTDITEQQTPQEDSSASIEQINQVNSLFDEQNNKKSYENSSNSKGTLFAQVSSEITDSSADNSKLSYNFNRPAGLINSSSDVQSDKNSFVQYRFESTTEDGQAENKIQISTQNEVLDNVDTGPNIVETVDDTAASEQTPESDNTDNSHEKELKREKAIKKKINRDDDRRDSHILCKSFLMIFCILMIATVGFSFYLIWSVLGGTIPAEDISYLKEKCNVGEKVSCKYLSKKYAEKAGLNNDYGKKAYFLAVENCNKFDDADSCEIVGDMLMTGRIVQRDIPKAGKYYSYSCALLSPSACEKSKNLEDTELPVINKIEDAVRNLIKSFFFREEGVSSFVKGLDNQVSSYDMDLTEKGLNSLYKGNYKVSTTIFIDPNKQRKVRITNIYDRISLVIDAYIPQMHKNCSESDKENCKMDGTEEYAIGQHDFNKDGVDEIVIAQINHSSSGLSGAGVIVYDVVSNKYQAFGSPNIANDGLITVSDNTVSMMSADGKTGYTWKYENDYFNRYPLER